MRQIIVTIHNIRQAHRSPAGSLVLTGEDADSGELVTFRSSAATSAEMDAYSARCFLDLGPAGETGITLDVEAADVLRVITGPVRGEWDSPGTSPEGDE